MGCKCAQGHWGLHEAQCEDRPSKRLKAGKLIYEAATEAVKKVIKKLLEEAPEDSNE